MSEGQAGTIANPAGGANGSTVTDWHTTLPEGLRADPTLANYKDVASLAQGHVELRKFAGADPSQLLKLPKAGEDYSPVWDRLGRPASPDKYEYKPPEGTTIPDADLAVIRQAAHKGGITQSQLTGFLNEYLSLDKAAAAQAVEARRLETEQHAQALKSEWKDQYEQNRTVASKGLQALFSEEDRNFLESSGALGRPGIVKALFKIGSTYQEDRMLGGVGGNAQSTRTLKEVELELSKTGAEMFKLKPMDPAYAAMKEKHEKLLREGAALKYPTAQTG